MLRFPCPSCNKELNAPEEKSGASVNCPYCRHSFQVPAPHQVEPGWSWETKASVVFWIVLILIPVPLAIFFPELFQFSARHTTASAIGILLIIAWLLAVYVWFAWFRESRRTHALATACQQLQLSLQPAPSEDAYVVFQVFPLFNIGFERTARNLMQGKVSDHPITLLDYHFRRSLLPRDIELPSKVNEARTYHQTVLAFWDVAEGLPNFKLVTRESWWTSPSGKNRTPKGCIADLKIGDGISSEFARNYKVGGKDEPAVRAFFTSDLVEFFAQHRGWDLETADGHVLLYQEKCLQKPDSLAEFINNANAVVQMLRAHASSMK
jgi:hypothetical protein